MILGIAEAGFFPGIIVYLSHWFRYEDRAKAAPGKHWNEKSTKDRAGLFDHSYPLAWGDDKVKPDAFLVGRVKLSEDMKTTTVAGKNVTLNGTGFGNVGALPLGALVTSAAAGGTWTGNVVLNTGTAGTRPGTRRRRGHGAAAGPVAGSGRAGWRV